MRSMRAGCAPASPGGGGGSVVVLPMRMSLPETAVPGAMRPSSSSFSYDACLMPRVLARDGFSKRSTDAPSLSTPPAPAPPASASDVGTLASDST